MSESETNGFFNSPRVHFMRNAMAHAGKTQRRIVSAWIGTAFAEADAPRAKQQWRSVADQLRSRVPPLPFHPLRGRNLGQLRPAWLP